MLYLRLSADLELRILNRNYNKDKYYLANIILYFTCYRDGRLVLTILMNYYTKVI